MTKGSEKLGAVERIWSSRIQEEWGGGTRTAEAATQTGRAYRSVSEGQGDKLWKDKETNLHLQCLEK